MNVLTAGELGAHAEAWDALVDTMEMPSPFLRSWWLSAVATNEPVYVLVLDGDRLIGGLPLERSSLRGVEALTFLGSGPLEPDHLDVVAAPADRRAVAQEVGTWLGRRGNRMIDLRGVTGGSPLAELVPGFGTVSTLEVAPFVELTGTPKDYLAARGGRTRSTVTRTAKRLDKAGISFVTVNGADADAVEAALSTLSRLHDGRWGDESGFLAAWQRFSAAAKAGAARGEVVFHELVDADGEPIAIEVDFEVANRTSFYQAGRTTEHDHRGSGSVLRYRIISRAIELGRDEFDLLRGGENYKTEWATSQRDLLRIRRGVGLVGRSLVLAAQTNVAVQDFKDRRRAAAEEKASAVEIVGEGGTGPVRSIAFYTDAAQIGGAETVAKTLLAELDARFDVTIIGAHAEVVENIAAVRPSASTIIVPPIDDRSDIAAMRALRSTLQSLKPDIFHANLSEGSSCQYGLLMALSIPGMRVVATENSPMGVRSELSRRIKRFSAPKFDAHIGVGRKAAALVEADVSLSSGSVEVIPNAVPVIEHRAPIERDDTVRVVAVSRFDRVKGLDVLVDAVGLLDRTALPRFEVVVFGDGAERAAIESEIERLGVGDVITLAGWADDVRQQLVDFDLFVLPSRLEGLPMSLLEAMHAGIAVVATDVGSVREVLDTDDVGTVVEPGDAAALAGAISTMILDGDRRAVVAANGQARALDRYTSTANVTAYQAVYDRVMSVPTKRRSLPRPGLPRRG